MNEHDKLYPDDGLDINLEQDFDIDNEVIDDEEILVNEMFLTKMFAKLFGKFNTSMKSAEEFISDFTHKIKIL